MVVSEKVLKNKSIKQKIQMQVLTTYRLTTSLTFGNHCIIVSIDSYLSHLRSLDPSFVQMYKVMKKQLRKPSIPTTITCHISSTDAPVNSHRGWTTLHCCTVHDRGYRSIAMKTRGVPSKLKVRGSEKHQIWRYTLQANLALLKLTKANITHVTTNNSISLLWQPKEE